MSDDDRFTSDKDADRYLSKKRKEIRHIFSDDEHPNKRSRIYEALGKIRKVEKQEKRSLLLKAAIDRRAIKKGYSVAPNSKKRFTQLIKVMMPKCPPTSIHRYALVLRYVSERKWSSRRLVKELSRNGGMRRIENSANTDRQTTGGTSRRKSEQRRRRRRRRG